jgi:hypothetical protein
MMQLIVRNLTKMRPNAIRIGVSAVLLACIANPLHADTIYVEGTNSTLATLDPTTGAVQVIGPTSGILLGGLGFSSNGTLYGLDVGMNLYSVSTSTGVATLLGPTGLTYGGNGYAMGATSDGTLFLQNSGNLYVFNPTTDHASLLGPLGFSTSADVNGDASNNLYTIKSDGSASLYSANKTTGQTTLIGAGSAGIVVGMAFANDTMYAMGYGGSTGVFSVSLMDGHDTLVSHYDTSEIGGIYTAATEFSISSVPEPSAFALAFTGLLTLACVWALRLQNVQDTM